VVCNNAGFIQTISIDLLKDTIKDFGMNCIEFDERCRDDYHSGNHFVDAWKWDEKQFAEWIIHLYNEEEWRNEFAKNGKEWIDKFASLWSMTDKARLLVEMMKERGYI